MTPSTAKTAAVVAIPAHDEAETIATCLRSIAQAAEHAIRCRAVDGISVVVVAHSCADETLALAQQTLSRNAHVLARSDVIRLDRQADVGAVRRVAVRDGLRRADTSAARTWIFSTDADSLVGSDWITQGISEASIHDAVAVLGMVDLDGWHGSAVAHDRYREIISKGLVVDTDGRLSHEHVYGANMLVRADAYRAVGGFPASGHGEDRRLAAALINGGHRIVRSRTWTSTTSARTLGRARDGLADLLRSLETTPTIDTAISVGKQDGSLASP